MASELMAGDREAAGAIAGMQEIYGAPAVDLRGGCGAAPEPCDRGCGPMCDVPVHGTPSGFLTPDEVTDLVRVAVLLALNGCHANAGQVRDILTRNKGTATVPLDYLVVDPSELL